MIAHSRLYEEASRYSNTMRTVVDIFIGDELVYPAVPVTDGKVTCDGGSKVRWTSDIELALYPWEDFPLIDSYKARYKVYRGIASLGSTQMLQLGEYRVDEVDRSARGQISFSGSGLEAYVIDARFIRPRTPPYGDSTIQTISDLITEVVPATPTVVAQNSFNKIVEATAPWERERMDAVLSLAESINADVYSNNEGVFVIRDIPTLSSVPIFTVDTGAGGVLLSSKQLNTRDKVYNAVSVSGQSADSDVAPVFGWAADMNPVSPTYFLGEFGQKPRFYSSQYLSSDAQCVAIAENLLVDGLAQNQAVTFESLALCFLEAGDVIQLNLADGSSQKNLLSKTTVGLSSSGTLSAETYVSPDVAGD